MSIHTTMSQGPRSLFMLNGQVSEGSLQSTKDARDIYIAIMGMTGAGKSTFISHCTDAPVDISDPGTLESCTQEVQLYKCRSVAPNTNVYLVDTPGFDDTNRKDTDILKEIATWLTRTYQREIRLSGILYLHRISDNRMGGCARLNLTMFRKLCGPEGTNKVIFLSTFWEMVDAIVGENREETLKNEFWDFFIQRGARVQRHLNTDDSAMAAIKNFIPSDENDQPEKMKLAIQTKMVDAHKNLDQTSAGQELQGELEKEKEKLQQAFNERAQEIQREKDEEILKILQDEQERQSKELQSRNSELQELKISMERMHERKIQKLEERLVERQDQERKYREEMNRMIQQHREDMQEIMVSREEVRALTQVIKELKASTSPSTQGGGPGDRPEDRPQRRGQGGASRRRTATSTSNDSSDFRLRYYNGRTWRSHRPPHGLYRRVWPRFNSRT